LRAHAEIYFRDVRCPATREDLVQEVCGLAWRWLRRLDERGKDVARFPMAFASLAARAVRCGRRVGAQEKGRDVLSPGARRRHGFRVERLPGTGRPDPGSAHAAPRGQEIIEEHLRGNAVTPVPDQVQFRLDFAAWVRTLTARERRLVAAMARRERTKDLARWFGLSAGRISQLRKEFQRAWNRFCGDATGPGPTGTRA
jgi:hypothetical protein